MTDTEKREKVMLGLECCAKGIEKCAECPYSIFTDANGNGFCLIDNMVSDALSLLKEQEARVLEYSEIEKHPLVWLEDNDKENVIPALFLQYNGWSAEFSRQATDKYVDTLIRSAKVVADERWYNVTWRAWSARPTEEQRKVAKWG